MRFFQDLGALVERRWRDEDYEESVFPQIAAEALHETNPTRHVSPWDIIRWVNTTTELPDQKDVDARFGDPPITLYDGPRFYIDVYYWLDGTTSIHQHAFCGAFQVLLGSSIHSRYSFEEQRRINAHFSTGRIVLNSVNLLEHGDIQRILPSDLASRPGVSRNIGRAIAVTSLITAAAAIAGLLLFYAGSPRR